MRVEFYTISESENNKSRTQGKRAKQLSGCFAAQTLFVMEMQPE